MRLTINHVLHETECRRYGVKPLSRKEVTTLANEGFSVSDLFSIASDVAAGFSLSESKQAVISVDRKLSA